MISDICTTQKIYPFHQNKKLRKVHFSDELNHVIIISPLTSERKKLDLWWTKEDMILRDYIDQLYPEVEELDENTETASTPSRTDINPVFISRSSTLTNLGDISDISGTVVSSSGFDFGDEDDILVF